MNYKCTKCKNLIKPQNFSLSSNAGNILEEEQNQKMFQI